MLLDKKIALITGGAGLNGLGFATAIDVALRSITETKDLGLAAPADLDFRIRPERRSFAAALLFQLRRQNASERREAG